jgi:hypothetical protein
MSSTPWRPLFVLALMVTACAPLPEGSVDAAGSTDRTTVAGSTAEPTATGSVAASPAEPSPCVELGLPHCVVIAEDDALPREATIVLDWSSADLGSPNGLDPTKLKSARFKTRFLTNAGKLDKARSGLPPDGWLGPAEGAPPIGPGQPKIKPGGLLGECAACITTTSVGVGMPIGIDLRKEFAAHPVSGDPPSSPATVGLSLLGAALEKALGQHGFVGKVIYPNPSVARLDVKEVDKAAGAIAKDVPATKATVISKVEVRQTELRVTLVYSLADVQLEQVEGVRAYFSGVRRQAVAYVRAAVEPYAAKKTK